MRINLGCGQSPIENYINVDMDTLEDLRRRYPNKTFSDDLVIEQWDIFNLPVEDCSVDEIRADCLFEHLSFKEEKCIFEEVKRALKIGGYLQLNVPDFESAIKKWIDAEDNLTACIFGSQNGDGQYHKNCYTLGKLQSIFKTLNFEVKDHWVYPWPRGGDDIIHISAKKL
jgi:predicted SAM-dependent methyltransferase